MLRPSRRNEIRSPPTINFHWEISHFIERLKFNKRCCKEIHPQKDNVLFVHEFQAIYLRFGSFPRCCLTSIDHTNSRVNDVVGWWKALKSSQFLFFFQFVLRTKLIIIIFFLHGRSRSFPLFDSLYLLQLQCDDISFFLPFSPWRYRFIGAG